MQGIARALYAFAGEEDGDLAFNENDIIRILRQDDSGWWQGQTDDGRRGEFPYNYVEMINETEAERIRTGSRFISRATHTNVEAVDNVQRVKVTNVRGSPGFTVEAILARKKVVGNKTMEDFRVLDATLRSIFPNFDRPLPPFWADKVFETEAASARKASVLEVYLQKLIGTDVEMTEMALISWLNPRESFNCSRDAKNSVKDAEQSAARNHGGGNSMSAAMATATPLARAQYTWEASDAVELPLQRGSLVAVRNQNTYSEGWWEGETADGQRGLFPSNYVKMLSDAEAKAVIRGDQAEAPAQPAGWAQGNTYNETTNMFMSPTTQMPKNNTAKMNKAAQRQRKTENNFAMPSLDAFDELLLEGFTMLQDNKLLIPSDTAHRPAEGDRVVISYVAFVWDCQKQRIIEFASSDLPDQGGYVGPLEFTVGKAETIKALERAVQSLEQNQTSRIVVRPDMGYGEVGSPPSVPPNCHLVYDVTLDSFSSGAAIPGPPVGGGNQGYQEQSLGDAYGNAAGGGNTHGVVQNRVRRVNQPRHQETAAYFQDGPQNQYSLAQMRDIVGKKAYVQYGVNPTFLEENLTDDAFAEAFAVNRTDFMLMPKWKRSKLKQDAGLY